MLSQVLSAWMQEQTWPRIRRLLEADLDVSYEHPYGFVVCRLRLDQFPGWRIRVHLWPGYKDFETKLVSRGVENQQVHCHGWPLASRVIVGMLQESTYLVGETPDGAGLIHMVTSSYGPGQSVLRAGERVDVSEISYGFRSSSDAIIEIPANAFHSTLPVAESVSLVATRNATKEPSYVIALGNSSDTKLVNARRLVANMAEKIEQMERGYLRGLNDDWASFVFFVDGDRTLMVRVRDRPESWQPVGGRKAFRDSDPLVTLVREVSEETTLNVRLSEITHISSQERDAGVGLVHFWASRIPESTPISIPRNEIIESRWWSFEELGSVPMYQGTRDALALVRADFATD